MCGFDWWWWHAQLSTFHRHLNTHTHAHTHAHAHAHAQTHTIPKNIIFFPHTHTHAWVIWKQWYSTLDDRFLLLCACEFWSHCSEQNVWHAEQKDMPDCRLDQDKNKTQWGASCQCHLPTVTNHTGKLSSFTCLLSQEASQIYSWASLDSRGIITTCLFKYIL